MLVQHYVNWERPGLSEAAKANLLKFVNEGGGLAVLHFANGAFNANLQGAKDSDWPDYRRLLLRRAWDESQGSTHDNYGPYRVVPTSSRIPSPPASRRSTPQTYSTATKSPPADRRGSEPLITAACQKTGHHEPLAYAFERGKGRVFQSMLGHSDVSMHAAGEFHRRGIAWAAGRPAVEPPFAPAPLVIEHAPAPRKRAEVESILGPALTAPADPRAKPLQVVLCASAKDQAHNKPGFHDYPLWRSRWSRLLGMAPGLIVDTANDWPSAEQWITADLTSSSTPSIPRGSRRTTRRSLFRQG